MSVVEDLRCKVSDGGQPWRARRVDVALSGWGVEGRSPPASLALTNSVISNLTRELRDLGADEHDCLHRAIPGSGSRDDLVRGRGDVQKAVE